MSSSSHLLTSVLSSPVSAMLLVPCSGDESAARQQSNRSSITPRTADHGSLSGSVTDKHSKTTHMVWLACDDGCVFVLDPTVRESSTEQRERELLGSFVFVDSRVCVCSSSVCVSVTFKAVSQASMRWHSTRPPCVCGAPPPTAFSSGRTSAPSSCSTLCSPSTTISAASLLCLLSPTRTRCPPPVRTLLFSPSTQLVPDLIVLSPPLFSA
jgi:hypothetical protein